MDVSRAQLSNLGGEVAFDDPGFPYRVRVALRETADRPEVISLAVESRGAPITAGVLTQIPVRQLAGIAASEMAGGGDESLYRALALPRPEGERSWSPDHFERVSRVASWARRTGRSDGEAGTVAEFWEVNPRTARRWIATARGRAEARPHSQTR